MLNDCITAIIRQGCATYLSGPAQLVAVFGDGHSLVLTVGFRLAYPLVDGGPVVPLPALARKWA